jgi:ABC-2 type transport system permease protein
MWLAAGLAVRRDFGSGLLAPTAGPATAAPSLRSPLGLAVRLHRGVLGWWGVSVLALGLIYGSFTKSIDTLLAENPSMKDVLAALGQASLTDSYLATSLLLLALMAAGPALQIVQRLRTEESEQRAEAMLATGTSRWRWTGSHLLVALAGSALILALGGLGIGVSYTAVGGGLVQIPRLVGAALTYLPAVWLLTALAVALFGLVPRWTAAGWVALIGCLVIAMFGALLDLPGWLLDLSPFQQTPAVPADPLRLLPLTVLTAVTIALIAIGLAAFRSRDLVTS